MIPIFLTSPFKNKFNYSFDMPITWQIPTIILLSLIYKKRILLIAFTIYLLLGLFIAPVFHQGGSMGYILTPNFGYLIGIYPLIMIIDILNKKIYLNLTDFLKYGILAITTMHITGIFYSFIQFMFHKQISIFLYNLGYFSLGKIGYHLFILIAFSILIKPINFIKHKR